MRSAPTLRTLEQVFNLLSWGAFALGTAAVLGLCAGALLSVPQTSPEQFLTRLIAILAAALAVTALFRLLVAICRRLRARNREEPSSGPDSMPLFEDSTFGR